MFNKKFSVAHYDQFTGFNSHMYYTAMKNADPAFLANLHDIYFGKYFYYTYNGEERRCGNPMGVEASDRAVDYLFKIQSELGVEITKNKFLGLSLDDKLKLSNECIALKCAELDCLSRDMYAIFKEFNEDDTKRIKVKYLNILNILI